MSTSLNSDKLAITPDEELALMEIYGYEGTRPLSLFPFYRQEEIDDFQHRPKMENSSHSKSQEFTLVT